MKRNVLALVLLMILTIGFSQTVDALPMNDLFKTPLKGYVQDNPAYQSVKFSAAGYVYPVSSAPDLLPGQDYSQRYKEDASFRNRIDALQPEGVFVILWKDFIQKQTGEKKNWRVAANGFVYDVSDLSQWANGKHRNLHEAGEELTFQLMRRSPHGVKIMERAVVVGVLGFEWDDLAAMNGKDYPYHMVAVQAMLYDVTELNRWRSGNHLGQHKSGEELSYQIEQRAPHNLSLLGRGYLVGILVTQKTLAGTILSKNASYELKEGAVYDKRINKAICYILD